VQKIALLSPVLERFETDLKPLDGKNILVLCSAGGDVAFWLARRMKQGKIVGIECARQKAQEQRIEHIVDRSLIAPLTLW